jgi:hypothetical protein
MASLVNRRIPVQSGAKYITIPPFGRTTASKEDTYSLLVKENLLLPFWLRKKPLLPQRLAQKAWNPLALICGHKNSGIMDLDSIQNLLVVCTPVKVFYCGQF